MAIDVTTPPARERYERLEKVWAEAPGLVGWLTTVNHKRIGQRYFFTAGAFFLAAGVEALVMRMQLVQPNEGVLSPSAYDQVMTMHGVTMIFLFVVPMLTGAFGPVTQPEALMKCQACSPSVCGSGSGSCFWRTAISITWSV